MKSQQVTLKEIELGIYLIEMKNTSEHNSFNEQVSELSEIVKQIQTNTLIKVVLIRGNQEYFSSGASIELLKQLADKKTNDVHLPRLILSIPVPVIVCMEENALGGGFALALSCDFIFLAKEKRYGFTFMNFGFTPGMGLVKLSQDCFGLSQANELLFTGKTIKGAGLAHCPGITRVLPAHEIYEEALGMARDIAKKPHYSLRMLKTALVTPKREKYEASFTLEKSMHESCLTEPAVQESLKRWNAADEY